MKKRHSFRRRLFAGFLLASLLPLLLCSAMLLQIFRLRLDSQLEEESREQLDHVISSLDGLYRGFQQTALALQASPYVAPALSRGQRAPPHVRVIMAGCCAQPSNAAHILVTIG